MAAADAMEQLVTARSDVDRACELLVSPSPGSLDRCSRVLEAAVQRLAESQTQLRRGIGDPSVVGEAYSLRADVRRAASLLEGANKFHLNWCRLRDAMTGGYTGRGDPSPVPRGSRISIRG
jgi:hypothetical protein